LANNVKESGAIMATGKILFINGELVNVTKDDVLRMVREKNVLIYFGLVAILIGFLRRNSITLDGLPWWGILLTVSVAGFFLIATHFSLIYYCVKSKIFSNFPIVEPLLFLIATLTSRFSSIVFIETVFHPLELETYDIIELCFYDYVHLMVFSFLFLQFVAPSTPSWKQLMSRQLKGVDLVEHGITSNFKNLNKNDIVTVQPEVIHEARPAEALPEITDNAHPDTALPETAEGAHPDAALPVVVEIGGDRFYANEITFIRAEDHYLHVHTKEGRSMVRSRLSDATKVLPVCSGMVVHRSYWVNFASISNVQRVGNGSLSLVLSCNEDVPVARAKRKTFLRLYRPSGLRSV
jgi:hypothetical protein